MTAPRTHEESRTHEDPEPREAKYTRVLGEWLARPDVRIARTLRHHDWVTADVIFQSLNVEPTDLPAYAKALARLVGSGHIVSRGDPVYYKLERELTAPKPPAAPGEPGREGEERGAWFYWRGSWRPL